MVQLSTLAKSIEDELNGQLNSTSMGISFKIHSTIGNYKKAITKTNGQKQVFVNGILRATTGTYTPVKELNNVDASLMLEFAVQQERVEDVQLILSTWTESVLGEVYNMGNWAVLITPQTTIPGVAKNATPVGSMVPLMLMLDIQLIQNGLVSNSVEWKINGVEINPTNVVVSNSRTPETNARPNLAVTQTNNQYDNETIVMTLPVSYTTAIQDLLNDIRAHSIDAVYRITRKDNFSDNLDGLYVLANSELNEESGKIVAITLTFVPADLIAQGFILSFDSNGGNEISAKEVFYGQEIGGLSTPRKTGYVFNGWYVDGNLITEETICSFNENKTAVASWYSAGIKFKKISGTDTYSVEGVTDQWIGGALVIPAQYKGGNVVEIGQEAFYENTQLTSITLPSTIRDIKTYGFYGCTNLTSITLPQGIQRLYASCFARAGLTSITVPSSVSYAGGGLFSYCPLTEAKIYTTNVSKVNSKANSWFLAVPNATVLHIPTSVSNATQTYGAEWNYIGTSGGTDIYLTYYADLT